MSTLKINKNCAIGYSREQCSFFKFIKNMKIKKPNLSKPYNYLSAVDIDVMNNLNSIKKCSLYYLSTILTLKLLIVATEMHLCSLTYECHHRQRNGYEKCKLFFNRLFLTSLLLKSLCHTFGWKQEILIFPLMSVSKQFLSNFTIN